MIQSALPWREVNSIYNRLRVVHNESGDCMMNERPWFVSGVAARVCWLLMGSAQAAGPEGAISQQEDIITQKSQDIASRRREEENQYRLRDTMTRTDSSPASLEVFSLPEEDVAFL